MLFRKIKDFVYQLFDILLIVEVRLQDDLRMYDPHLMIFINSSLKTTTHFSYHQYWILL
jgi:hypothetical protein